MKNARGFTLIELMVVIAIIAVLAIGSLASYNIYTQKARDAQRILQIKRVQVMLESYFNDNGEYPLAQSGSSNAVIGGIFLVHNNSVAVYEPFKSGQTCAGAAICNYVYGVAPDFYGVAQASFEVSTAFENTGNITNYAATDGGENNARLEIGKLKTADGQFGIGTHIPTNNANDADAHAIILTENISN